MTTPLTTSQPHSTGSVALPAERPEAEAGPYSQPSTPMPRYPVDAVLIDAIRATIGPFVPEPWRTTPDEPRRAPATLMSIPRGPGADFPLRREDDGRADTPSVELPWIDAYLGATEAAAETSAAFEAHSNIGIDGDMAESVVEAAVASKPFAGDSAPPSTIDHSAPSIAATFAEIDAVSVDEPAVVAEQVPLAESATSEVRSHGVVNGGLAEVPGAGEEWPMDEAGAALRAIASDMPSRDSTPVESTPPTVQRVITPLYVPPVAATPPLPMWGDDDLMDIMPTKPSAAGAAEPWAEQARRESERVGNPHAVANALETLAQRVRRGELELPAYAPDVSDAALLAAALAALLGVRR